MIRKYMASDYAICCEMELDDHYNFIRLLRVWEHDYPGAKEIPVREGDEAYAKRAWEDSWLYKALKKEET